MGEREDVEGKREEEEGECGEQMHADGIELYSCWSSMKCLQAANIEFLAESNDFNEGMDGTWEMWFIILPTTFMEVIIQC